MESQEDLKGIFWLLKKKKNLNHKTQPKNLF